MVSQNKFDYKETRLENSKRRGITIRIMMTVISKDTTTPLKITKTATMVKETTTVIYNTSKKHTEIETTIDRGMLRTTRATITIMSYQIIKVREQIKGLDREVKVMNSSTSEETLL